MSFSRGFGCIPDLPEDVAEDLEHRHVGALLGAEIAAENIDYSGLLEDVPDQASSSSCVGQAFATAIYLRAKISGNPIPRPSAKAIYDLARLVDSPKALIDLGSRPRAAIQGMQDAGLVAEERWPLTDTNVNTPPPLDVFEAGLDALLTGHYRIDGADIPTLLRTALVRGFVPVFAMQVDDAYQGYDGIGVYSGLQGPTRGSHMQAIVGSVPGAFLVANSWGRDWGIGGFSWIADPFFNTPAVFDVLVATVIPKVLR